MTSSNITYKKTRRSGVGGASITTHQGLHYPGNDAANEETAAAFQKCRRIEQMTDAVAPNLALEEIVPEKAPGQFLNRTQQQQADKKQADNRAGQDDQKLHKTPV